MPSSELDIIMRARDEATAAMGYVNGTLGNLAPTLEHVGQSASKASGHIGGLIDGLGKMGLAVFGITQIAGAVGQLASSMVAGNAEFERYEVQFGVLLGSAAAAKDRLAELTEFGAKTPFELPEVVRADKILQGFGLHSEEAAKKFGMSGKEIRTIAGDVASGAGSSFEEMATYIGKFSSGATGDAMARFTELGIATRDDLTKMGLEFSKSGELMSPLPKATETLLKFMKTKYGGMMDAQSGTFEGMMSNLTDWIGNTKRALMAPIFEVLKDKLANVLAFLGSDAVKQAVSVFATGLANGIGSVLSAGAKFADMLTLFWNKIDLVINGGESFDAVFGEWAGIIDTTLAAIKPFTDVVSELVGYFTNVEDAGLRFHQALTDLIGSDAANWIVSLVQAIKPLDGMTSSLADFIGANLTPILITFGAMVMAVIVPAFIAWAAGAISAAVATVVALAPVVLAVAAVGVVVGALAYAWSQNWGDIQGKTEAVLGFIGPLLQQSLAGWQSWWGAHGASIMAILGAFWDNLVRGWGVLMAGIQAILDGFGSFWKAHGATIVQIATVMWENIQTVFGAAMTILGAVFDAFAALFEGDFKGFGEKLRVIWDAVWKAIGDILKNSVDLLVALAGELAQAIWNKITTTDWPAVGKSIIDGLVKGLRDNWSSFVNTIRDLAEAAWNTIKGFFGISSPSKLMMTVGANIVGGLILGVKRTWPELDALIQAQMQDSLKYFETHGTAFDKLMGPAVDFLGTGKTFGGALAGVATVIGAIIDRLTNTIDSRALSQAADATAGILENLEKLGGSISQRAISALGNAGKTLGALGTKAGIVDQIKAMVTGFESMGMALPPDLLAAIMEIAASIGGPFSDAIKAFLALSPQRAALAELQALLAEFQLGQQLSAMMIAMLNAGLSIPDTLLDLLKRVPRTPGGYLDKIIEWILKGAAGTAPGTTAPAAAISSANSGNSYNSNQSYSRGDTVVIQDRAAVALYLEGQRNLGMQRLAGAF